MAIFNLDTVDLTYGSTRLQENDASVNSPAANSNVSNGPLNNGLRILIVGAGIGGLTAAIGLRKQGHEVLVFEQSSFAYELGAAVHLAPNSNGILRRLGIYAEDFGANLLLKKTEYTKSGTLIKSADLSEVNKIWQHPWLLAHRVHLHDTLKKRATSTEETGRPVMLKTASRVADVDCETATVLLESGEQVQGDFIIGADGVHSITRKRIPGGHIKPFSTGENAYRFIISRKLAQADPIVAAKLQAEGELIIWFGQDRKAVLYPTTNNELLNFVCIYNESETESGGEGWNSSGQLEHMLKIYHGFDPALLGCLRLADPDNLKMWNLLDMEVLPTWTNGRLLLLGDAAHPFLPHLGQGAGAAIEDAASVAVLFPKGVPREEIIERVKLYEKIRLPRAHKIQEYSRLSGGSAKKSDASSDMSSYTTYNLGHDEWDNSTQMLRKWTWDKKKDVYWRMPISFGPMPGPRQSFTGNAQESAHSKAYTASIKFKTSRTLLQNMFPANAPGFRFKSPGTIAYASFSITTLTKMDWLGGSGYNHLGLYIHGVEYVKKDGSRVNGVYLPILFESLTDPIVSGREEIGMPKLFSSIDVYRRADSLRVNTSWEGAQWGNFVFEGLEEVEAVPQTGSPTGSGIVDDGVIVYRYIPSVGKDLKGVAELEYPVIVPFKGSATPVKMERVFKASKASFKIDPLDWDALPTLHHIISRLAEIPVFEIVEAKLMETLGVSDVANACRIE